MRQDGGWEVGEKDEVFEWVCGIPAGQKVQLVDSETE